MIAPDHLQMMINLAIQSQLCEHREISRETSRLRVIQKQNKIQPQPEDIMVTIKFTGGGITGQVVGSL